MARGGSLPGERRGGRQKGSLNKRTVAKEAFKASRLDVTGVSPSTSSSARLGRLGPMRTGTTA